jgi:hypothetical protein
MFMFIILRLYSYYSWIMTDRNIQSNETKAGAIEGMMVVASVMARA